MITPGFPSPSTPKQGRKTRDNKLPTDRASSGCSIIKIRTFPDILREFTKEQWQIKQTTKEFSEGEFKDRG